MHELQVITELLYYKYKYSRSLYLLHVQVLMYLHTYQPSRDSWIVQGFDHFVQGSRDFVHLSRDINILASYYGVYHICHLPILCIVSCLHICYLLSKVAKYIISVYSYCGYYLKTTTTAEGKLPALLEKANY